MTGFVGTITNKIDSKGRVSVPAPFRAVLARDGYEGLHCYPSLDMNAIDAGGNELLAVIGARLARFEPFTEDHDYLSTAFYGMSEALRIDQDGRVMLSEALKDFAGLTDQVTFVGQGYKFQIWHPERFAEHREEARRRALVLRKGTPVSGPVAGPVSGSATGEPS
ncbi:MAG: transcriptional regulator MraZ [Hyphomicrobiales bacterium]|nr:MAG: transcriptional regulator MraZ [Hyphomicrobiales bacterium]